MDILQRLIPRPKQSLRDEYEKASAKANADTLYYFSMVFVVVFLIHLLHHTRSGDDIFAPQMYLYTSVYCASVGFGLVNLWLIGKLQKKYRNYAWYLELMFMLFVAVISVLLAVAGVQENVGPVSFVLGLMSMSVMLQGRLVSLFVTFILSWLSFAFATYQLSGAELSGPAIASTLSTILICVAISRLLEKMRIGHFESNQEILRQNKKLSDLSNKDPLTELANRRFFEATLKREITRSQRFGNNLSVLILDVDNFKQINDTYGHNEGDHVLKVISQILRSYVREVDTVCRYGGEEFVILLAEANSRLSQKIGERIRKAIAARHFMNIHLPVTVSIGHKQYQGESAQDFIEEADKLMYRAKQEGKNRLVSCGVNTQVKELYSQNS